MNQMKDLVGRLASLPITTLINNVGGTPILPPHLRNFSTYTPSEVDASINMNSRFMSQLTLQLLPILCSNEPSLIINLSSGGKFGLPGLVMYSATKAFVSGFSKALAREAKAFGFPLDVISIIPGDVHSQGNNKALTASSPTSRQFAKVLFDLTPRAVDRGMLEFSPWFTHTLGIGLLSLMPEWLMFRSVLKGYEDKRKAHADAAKTE